MPDNQVERVHEPTFAPGKVGKPASAPSAPKKIERPPVKSRPAPPAKK